MNSINYHFVPNKINIADIVRNEQPTFKYDLDNFNYILSVITEIPAWDSRVNYNGFIPLNSTKLQRRVHDYYNYTSFLVANGILLTDNHYIVNEKSKGYKFHPDFVSLVEAVPITKTSLIRIKSKLTLRDILSRKKYHYLYKWFNYQLTIDKTRVNNYVAANLETNIIKLGLHNAILKFNINYVRAYNFYQQRFSFSVDTTGHRLHTNLTNIKSNLRNFVSYGGERLISFDFVNCQTLLSCHLLNECFYVDTEKGKTSQMIKLMHLYTNYNILFSTSPLIMLVKQRQQTDAQDINKYIEHCQKGTIYEYMHEQIERVTGKRCESRKELKDIIFAVLFSSNKYLGQPKAEPKRIFKQIFPGVYEIFKLIKTRDNTLLPILLQRIESMLMLDRIALRITKEFPKKPIYTIHDSIVTTLGHNDEIIAILRDEMLIATGLKCQIRVEVWE